MVENYMVCNCKQVSYADIANALDTTVDRLLCDCINNSINEYSRELSELISDCSPIEMRFLMIDH